MNLRLPVFILTAAMTGMLALTSAPAEATTVTADNPCGVQGWYQNDDEKPDAPTRSTAGFFFDSKDLIHHATSPIDLADIKTTTLSFVADKPGKVLGKMETANPYSTIIQNDDGTFWSTAMTYDQIGGQGHPVENVSDLVGTAENPRPTKPGKAAYSADTHVVTFGVGYAVVDGNTTVSSITFHGVKYVLTCAAPHTSPGVSASSSPKPAGTATRGHTSSSAVHVAGVVKGEPGLPVTGPNLSLMAILGVILVMFGAAFVLFSLAKRRKKKFEA